MLDTRNKLLLGGLVLMLILSYHFAIKKTLTLRKEFLASQNQQRLATGIPEQLQKTTKKEKEIDSKLEALNLGTSSLQNDLIKFLNQASMDNKVKIIELGAPHTFDTGNTVTKTYTLNLEGGFNDVLQVIHTLEHNGGFGAVSHFTFEKHKNYRNGKSRLEATVFLEVVE